MVILFIKYLDELNIFSLGNKNNLNSNRVFSIPQVTSRSKERVVA